MSHLLDTNLLLRLVEPAHAMHSEALRALETLLNRDEEVALVPQTLMEFWVVATRPKERNGLGLTAEGAESEMARLTAQFPLLPDPPGLFAEWHHLVTSHRVVGVRAHDVRLVAAMRLLGISHLLTFNVDDFREFSGIEVVHPSMIQD